MTERRSQSGKPPTYLIQSYNAMSAKHKADLRRLGIWILLFSIALPMVGQLLLAALGRPGLSAFFFLFSGVGLVVGLALVWPQLGIWAVGALPRAVGKLLPSKLADALKRPERRKDDPDPD